MVGNACDGLVNAIGTGANIDANAYCQVKPVWPLPALQQNAAGLFALDQNIIRPLKADGTLSHMGVNGFRHSQGCDKGQIGRFGRPAGQRKQARCEQIAGLTQPSPAPPAPALGLLKAANP
jgi:hypothetical protein